MKDDYAPRICVSLAEGTLVGHPPDMPELVHMHDPATYVFTDFTHNRPVVIAPDVSIDVAMNKMKSSGVGLLLVIDQAGAVIGEITIADILGDVPVRMAQESGMDHSEIVVDMVMTPRKDIKVLEWSHMKDGKVGHIVATLHQLESFAPNIPTEEVFTSPHRAKANGRIQASKPLSYFGDLIDGFALEISEGRVVSSTAEQGQEVLERVLATDEGSTRFGETAMVPQSGAVAAEELIWNNMLYDENDACHIALGQSFTSCLEGADDMSDVEKLNAGLNQSSIHVDFVVGSNELSVFGVYDDGTEEPIITKGEWGFTD